MTINHDPDSVVGFHNDGSPVHSTLAITFQELEYVISEDSVDFEYSKNQKKTMAEMEQITGSKN